MKKIAVAYLLFLIFSNCYSYSVVAGDELTCSPEFSF
jgi:hypothetical protein